MANASPPSAHTSHGAPSAPYRVELRGCPDLPADQRAAAELRFRMALEAALGGAAYVLPSLQGYMLAQSLADLADEEEPDDTDQQAGGHGAHAANPHHGAEDGNEDDDEDEDALEQLVALWETAEAQAIVAAMKPLGDSRVEAHFQIVPL